ncbi:pyridoxamine 5'-phosphate oxidase family protein [Saccharopolyspora sp. HNM0983]|uniref:Pyridoxamine 5'-phosphate oxidase family protein n=1 Tax=Saccharopolyspora montiporae TaxID=2781240 RepID=A0A929B5K3_9PSEU|nr:pyridoxamine 5'-phosphate oxidase family protein [Saccharopolyspora sp. HNM0983]MBE9373564.1 pyridoxamine 5'-phosphate oxidase family protein [Saccharopolyspora sp. HNM0983]
MALSKQEREQFLAEPHIGALSVQEHTDRGPLIVPIWYEYEPGGPLTVHTGPEARKAHAIHAAGRFSLLVQRTAPTVRYVSVEGPVTGTSTVDREQTRLLAARYLPAELVADFVDYQHTQLGEHIAIHMQPQRWISSDLGAF